MDEQRPVVPRKKLSMPKRMVNLLIGTIDFNAIGDNLIKEIIMPKIEDMLYSSVESAARQIFLKGDRPVGFYRARNTSGNNTTNYNRVSTPSNTVRATRTGGYSVKNVSFESRHLAKVTLDNMRNMARECEYVTVATFYEECGLEVRPEDYKFGWRTIDSGAYISSDGAGDHVLYMPAPVRIK